MRYVAIVSDNTPTTVDCLQRTTQLFSSIAFAGPEADDSDADSPAAGPEPAGLHAFSSAAAAAASAADASSAAAAAADAATDAAGMEGCPTAEFQAPSAAPRCRRAGHWRAWRGRRPEATHFRPSGGGILAAAAANFA